MSAEGAKLSFKNEIWKFAGSTYFCIYNLPMATRTEQINIRCSTEFKKYLDALSSLHNGYYRGMTQADILHDLVEDAGKRSLPKDTYRAIYFNEPLQPVTAVKKRR
jgi:hypothetical protein